MREEDLLSIIDSIHNMQLLFEEEMNNEQRKEDREEHLKRQKIFDLDITKRAFNVLFRAKMYSVREIVENSVKIV